ncbi:MAG: hypothetical protein D6734_11035 [Candidatus Schekmanbacteria bacterium]|nr:MAG: hypothetical protein D6734_11035 [Candidatus Schekmanbacteria bacterium]
MARRKIPVYLDIDLLECSPVGIPSYPDAHKGIMEQISKAKWTTAYINDLPDSSFAVIERGGKKDSEGKTVPRTYRHLPYKDADGKVDLPHLRNALARMNQIVAVSPDDSTDRIRAAAKRVLSSVAERYLKTQQEEKMAKDVLKQEGSEMVEQPSEKEQPAEPDKKEEVSEEVAQTETTLQEETTAESEQKEASNSVEDLKKEFNTVKKELDELKELKKGLIAELNKTLDEIRVLRKGYSDLDKNVSSDIEVPKYEKGMDENKFFEKVGLALEKSGLFKV